MQETFNNYSKANLNFSVPDMRYYYSLPLCALDAILSIRLNYYKQVSPTIDRFCNHFRITREANNPFEMPTVQNQLSVNDFISKIQKEGGWNEKNIRKQIGNYKTAGHKKSIIFKSEAFVQFIEVLRKYNINTYQDLKELKDIEKLEKELKAIKGQKVSVDYFFMLAGDKNGVKIDTHLTNYAHDATGINNLTHDQMVSLYKDAATHFGLSPRHFDHIVWSWQRDRTINRNKRK